MINCPYCGKLTDPKLDTCPHCGGYVQKKLVGQSPASKRSQGQTCPSCHALVQDGDIICVGCGTNLLTGHKIAEEKTMVAKEKTRRTWLPWAVVVGVAVVLVGVGLAFAFYAFTRDPVKRAVQLAYAGNLLEAGNILSKHVESHKEDSKAYFELGRVQWKMGRMAEAAGSFQKAYEADEQNLDAAMLSVAAFGGGTDPGAQQQVAILRKVTEAHPDHGRAWYLLGLALGAQNNVEGEISALKQALSTGMELKGARETMAVALGIQGDVAEAERELTLAAQTGEADANQAAAMGFVASLAGKVDVAQEQLAQAVESETDVKTQALTRLGLLLLSEGRPLEAGPYLAQAVEGDKRNTLAQFFSAVALEAQGQENEALTIFDALSRETGPLAGEAAVRATSIYLAQGSYDKARETISRAETASMNTAGFHTVRGRVFAAAGELEQAAGAYEKARQVDALHPTAYLESGLLSIRQQQFGQAVSQLEKYLELAGDATGSRSEEIGALVAQLKQTLAEPSGATAGAGSIQ